MPGYVVSIALNNKDRTQAIHCQHILHDGLAGLQVNAGLIPNTNENPRNRKAPSAGGSGYSTRPSIHYGYAWSGPSRGRINLNGFCYTLSLNNNAITV
jgi:hypothetical protein